MSQPVRPSALRKTEDEIRQTLDQLDQSMDAGASNDVRRAERYPYRVRSLMIELPTGGSTFEKLVVPSRNISRDGVAFLIGRFVYPGTPIRVHLVTLHSSTHTVAGRVVRCRYLQGSGSIHEAGVRFDSPIDVVQFHQAATNTRVLLADQSESIHKLVGKFLKSRNLELVCVSNGPEAVRVAGESVFDLILMDADLPEMDGVTAVRKLRSDGYARPIYLLSGLDDDQVRTAALEAGCNGYLRKPCSKQALQSVVAAVRSDPIVSSLSQDPEMIETIDEYVATLPLKVEELERAYAAQDRERLAKMVRVLRTETGGYGFEFIMDAAKVVEVALQNPATEMGVIRRHVNELIRLCMAARPAGLAASAADAAHAKPDKQRG